MKALTVKYTLKYFLCLWIYQVNYLNLHQITLKNVHSQTIHICVCNKYMQISNSFNS